MLKKIVILFAAALFVGAASAQTLEEAIATFTDGNGGKDRLMAINSIQVQSTMSLPMMGMQSNITTIREKNKLFRIQTSGGMSTEATFTVITDTAGYTYTPAIPGFGGFGGMEAAFTKMTAEEMQQQAYQKDCAGFFGPLVDYAAKGHKAALGKSEKVNDVDCYQIKLTLNTGQEMNYFIAKNNGQVKRIQLPASVALESFGMGSAMKMFGGGRNVDRKIDVDYEKYKIFDGFPMPTKQTLKLGSMAVDIENTAIKVNQPIDAKWYQAK
jgi:hypothetical protein